MSLAAAQDTIAELGRNSLPWKILGAGSNVVFPDEGLNIALLRFGRDFSGLSVAEELPSDLGELENLRLAPETRISQAEIAQELKLCAFAGAPLMKLSRLFSDAGFSGLEFAAGIPASIGGAVAMNAGAHQSQMSDIVERIYYLDKDASLKVISKEEAGFDYRCSRFPKDGLIVAAGLSLSGAKVENVREKRRTCLEYRKRTQPLHLPSAGSVFKNPEGKINEKQKIFAAQLIEHVGLKGVSCGGVGFSEMHANWLVKLNDTAKTAHFLELVERAREAVEEQFSEKLKTEIRIW
jgi:UDP-N-acetylmuramate dehydrogenase